MRHHIAGRTKAKYLVVMVVACDKWGAHRCPAFHLKRKQMKEYPHIGPASNPAALSNIPSALHFTLQ